MSKPAPTPAEIKLPNASTLLLAAQHSIKEDKPIMLDYWEDSFPTASGNSVASIGIRSKTEKMLVKSTEEFTSNIQNAFTSKSASDELIVVTENSIYIVSNRIDKRQIE